MKYAIQIRLSDLPLLAILNGGVEPMVEKDTYLIIDPDGTNEIVTKREFLTTHEIGNGSPLLLRLTK